MQDTHGCIPCVVHPPFMIKSTMVRKYDSDHEKKNGKKFGKNHTTVSNHSKNHGKKFSKKWYGKMVL